MTSLIRVNQIATPAGAFFSDAAQPFGMPHRHPNRAFFGLSASHRATTDRRALSATEAEIATGTVTMTFTDALTNPSVWQIGDIAVAIADESNQMVWMRANVSAVSANEITLDVFEVSGTGTFDSWAIMIVDPLSGWQDGWRAGSRFITETDYAVDQALVAGVRDFGTVFGAATRTSGGTPAIGFHGEAVASNANEQPVWAGYFAAYRAVSGAGNASGVEIEAGQLPGPSPGNTGVPVSRRGLTPYKAKVTGEVVVARIGAGADRLTVGRSYFVDAMMDFGNNGAAAATIFNVGFNAVAREGTPDDMTLPSQAQGYGAFARLPYDIGVSWFSRDPSGAVGSGTQEDVFRIRSSIAAPTVVMDLTADDSGLVLRQRGKTANLFRVDYIAEAVSWPVLIPDDGTLAGFGVRSTAANANLALLPHGAGLIYIPVANIPAHANDAAAAAAGVPVGCLYANSATGAVTQRRT